METLEGSKLLCLFSGVGLVVALAACSEPQIVCGGEVYPTAATESELQLVSAAKVAAAEFCGRDDSGCDFAVYKTRDGMTVKATRMVANDGKCVNFIGDERFFSFDASGRLQRVINGL